MKQTIKKDTDFGAVLKQLREEANMSQYMLNKLAGLSLSTSVNIEKRGSCTLHNAVKVLDALDYDLVIVKRKE